MFVYTYILLQVITYTCNRSICSVPMYLIGTTGSMVWPCLKVRTDQTSVLKDDQKLSHQISSRHSKLDLDCFPAPWLLSCSLAAPGCFGTQKGDGWGWLNDYNRLQSLDPSPDIDGAILLDIEKNRPKRQQHQGPQLPNLPNFPTTITTAVKMISWTSPAGHSP